MPQLPFGNLDALVTRKGVAWTLVALAVAAILVALTPSGNDRLTSNRFLILFGVAAAIILGLAAIGIVVSLVEGWRNKLHRQQAFPLAWDDVIKQQEGHHRQLLGGRRARFEHSYSYLLSRDGVEGRTDVWCRSLGPWDYQAYILGNEWRGKRAAKFRELGAERCESPGCVNSDDLQVHHLTYLRLGRERLSDLVVLCMGCHALLHGHLPEMPENRGSLETDLEMGF